MAFTLGSINEFTDANTILTPEVLVAAKAIQLPTNKGVIYQAMRAPQRTINQKEFEIYSRTSTGLSGVIGNGTTGWADTTTTAALPMAATALNVLTVGSVMSVEGEIVVVKSVDRTANTVTVFARGMGGTTAATHANGVAFTIVGIAGSDGDLKNVESRNENTVKYKNYIQTLFEMVEYQQSELLVGRKGLDAVNELAIQRQEAMLRVAKMLSTMAINGVKGAGTNKLLPYMSAGLFAQLSDDSSGTRAINRYNAGSTAFTETHLKAALKQTMALGTPDVIVVNPTKKEIINGFVASSTRLYQPEDHKAGTYISQYDYEGHILDIMVDADVPNDRVGILNLPKCQKGFLEGDVIRFEKEPDKSSREHSESIQGSVGFAVEGVGYEHCDIYGLT
jgi:hypothetical protein